MRTSVSELFISLILGCLLGSIITGMMIAAATPSEKEVVCNYIGGAWVGDACINPQLVIPLKRRES